ncbi:hypothetical protein [Nonomuraea sp. NPDC049129]|uniref:hypothetical protein n=1 Tax=Nonomuraea sp. NPDC049129 TaxID=3155272 RepID=UPI0033CB12F9
MLIGPNLLTLGEPRTLWGSEDITISQANHQDGDYYEIQANQGRATVAGLIKALQRLPEDARLRDVFLGDEDEENCYINIWKEAA